VITKTPYKGLIVTLWQSEIDNLIFLIREYSITEAIELGTYQGGSALVMADAGIKVVTYDNVNLVEEKDNRIEYRVADVFEKESEIKALIGQSGLKMLFCDNGNKKKEINTFAKYLKTGDILVAHDYIDEWVMGDVQESLVGFDLVELPNKNRLMAWKREI